MVYGGTGKAARDWPSYDALVTSLTDLHGDETLLVQSGRPVGVMRKCERGPDGTWHDGLLMDLLADDFVRT